MRRLAVVALALAAGCRGQHHADSCAPVKGLVKEVAAGTQLLSQFRAYVVSEVPDGQIREWTDTLRLAVKAFGHEVEYEVLRSAGSSAEVRASFGSEASRSFVVHVAERWSGWWVVSVDLAPLKPELDRANPGESKGEGWWR